MIQYQLWIRWEEAGWQLEDFFRSLEEAERHRIALYRDLQTRVIWEWNIVAVTLAK